MGAKELCFSAIGPKIHCRGILVQQQGCWDKGSHPKSFQVCVICLEYRHALGLQYNMVGMKRQPQYTTLIPNNESKVSLQKEAVMFESDV